MYQLLTLRDEFFGDCGGTILGGIAHAGQPVILGERIPFVDAQISTEAPGQFDLQIAGLLYYTAPWEHVDFIRNLKNGLIVHMGPSDDLSNDKLSIFTSSAFTEHIEHFCRYIATDFLQPLRAKYTISSLEKDIKTSSAFYESENDSIYLFSADDLPFSHKLSFNAAQLVKDGSEVYLEISIKGLESPLYLNGSECESLILIKDYFFLEGPNDETTRKIRLTEGQSTFLRELASLQMLHSPASPYHKNF